MPNKKIERNYLKKMTLANARLWFRYRCQIIDHIKGNKSSIWEHNMACRLLFYFILFILQYFSATTRIALKANECLSRTLSHYTNTEKVKLEILSPSSLVSISQEICSCNSTILEGHRLTFYKYTL